MKLKEWPSFVREYVPDGFDPAFYDVKAKQWSPMNWYSELWRRSYRLERHPPFKLGELIRVMKLDDAAALYCEMKGSPLFHSWSAFEESWTERFMTESDEEPGLSVSDFREREHGRRKALYISTVDPSMPYVTFFSGDVSGRNPSTDAAPAADEKARRMVPVLVEMNAPDAAIRSAFDRWLKDARRDLGMPEPVRLNRKTPGLTQANFDSWVDSRVLPYLDLQIAQLNGVVSKPRNVSQWVALVFPETWLKGPKGEDWFRKQTMDTAKWLTTNPDAFMLLNAAIADQNCAQPKP